MYAGHKHTSYKLDSCLTPTDAHIVSGSEDGALTAVCSPGCTPLQTHAMLPCGRRHLVIWASDGSIISNLSESNCLLSGSASGCVLPHAGKVFYWELVEAAVVKSFQAHKGAVCSIAVHPEASLLLTAGVDGSVRVWK
jgi:WD40 repeat protein